MPIYGKIRAGDKIRWILPRGCAILWVMGRYIHIIAKRNVISNTKRKKRKGCEMANRERVQRIVRRLERMEEAKLEIVEKVVMILAAADVRTAARIQQMAMAVWRLAK